MEFLNPTALYGLFALPLLLVPYLLRRKPRRYVFSSLFIFSAMGADPRARPLGRLRLPLIFLLQLLLLALMIFALGEPVLTARPSKVAIVLDNSASMQALTSGKTRFDSARDKALEIFADLDYGAVLDIYLNAPRLERFGRANFTPPEAARALRGLKPVDLGEAPLDYNGALSQLAREQEYDRVYFLTDRPARGQSGVIRVITVGQPQANYAITDFGVHHGSLTDVRLTGSAEVANFSSTESRIVIAVRGGGAPLVTRELVVAAGAQVSTTFEGLPLHPYYEALIETRDSLALDNRRYAVSPATKKLRILGISPRPQALASLRAIAGVELDIVAPREYEKTDRGRYDLEIFHFSAPAVLPRNPTLFIIPPSPNELVDLRNPATNSSVSGWREGHPLTRYVNFSLFRPSYARALKPQTPGESIVSSPDGPLVYATTKHGVGFLVLGFDPFPYLGQDNLPMSIFTVNMIDWFLAFSGDRGKATGEPIPLIAGQSGAEIITPAGEQISLRSGASIFSETRYQGIYQMINRAEKSLMAVNLRDLNESDLRQSAPIVLAGEGNAKGEKSVLLPFWPYFMLAALILVLLEWFINPRMAPFGRRIQVRGAMPFKVN
ncbi:MAG: VWA domain-containing protein [Deltaproteobacteria bacterium]|nr:VWA domain-containing protein [Deltaproteobacteria bacterium]